MSIRGILRFGRRFFVYHYQRLRHKSSKELCRDIWLNFALGTAQSCAVYMVMYRDSVIVLLHNAKLQAASHCCLYKFSPKHSPIKTKPHFHWSEWWTITIFWSISNKPLSFWNLKIALVDLEILEKRYITLSHRHVINGILPSLRI